MARDVGPRPAYLDTMDKTDIFISGAGIAGMILAALLAKRGYAVVVCDPSTPADAVSDDDSDLRSTAYLAPSIAVLEEAGLWRHLAPDATPLKALRVMDSTGWPPRQTATRTFRPADLDLPAFGQNVMNWRAHRTLLRALRAAPGVDLRLGTGFLSMLARESEVRVALTDGSRLRASLVIGADGRTSPLRVAAGIGHRDRRYGQTALAFACTHSDPHDHVSTEVYNAGGAFVTVPLPDHDGKPSSSIVWMSRGPRIQELKGLGAAEFDAQLTQRALHIMGPMQRITPLRSWPIITRTARALTARRTALVAEAAHVLPPIGAQGLNTSIADIAALADAIGGGDPGRDAALDAYARIRHRDMAIRASAIDAFNRLCQADAGPLQSLRTAGLKAVHDLAPLRRNVMMAGMGGT